MVESSELRMTFLERPDGIKDSQIRSVKEYLLAEHRTVFLEGVIRDSRCQLCGHAGDTESANLMLALAAHSSAPIKMFITSPGGMVDTAMMLYDTMKIIDAPIYTVGRFCASAAAILMAAGAKRYLFPSARMMLHLPSGQLGGTTAEIAIQKEEIDKTQQSLVDALIECGVKKTPRQILKDINREKWFNPKEAIEYGLADEIVTPELLKGWLAK